MVTLGLHDSSDSLHPAHSSSKVQSCVSPLYSRVFRLKADVDIAEWWTDRIQPWVHYVPIQVDYSDLYDTLGFVSSLALPYPLFPYNRSS